MTITRGCMLAGVAIILALLQHILYVLGFLTEFDNWPPIWLVINSIEVVLMLSVSAMLWATRRTIATVIGAIGIVLLVAIVTEHFAFNLSNEFWLPMSTTIIFCLILIAMFAPRE